MLMMSTEHLQVSGHDSSGGALRTLALVLGHLHTRSWVHTRTHSYTPAHNPIQHTHLLAQLYTITHTCAHKYTQKHTPMCSNAHS